MDRATRMVHLIPVYQTITVAETTRVYWESVGRLHGIPKSIVSNRGPTICLKILARILEVAG